MVKRYKISQSILSNRRCFFYFGSQIDDKEFDIPQVDTPPTLESILNEVEYMLLYDDCTEQYCITHDNLNEDCMKVILISSSEELIQA